MSIWLKDIAWAKSPLRYILAVSKPYLGWAFATLFFGAVANGLIAIQPLIYKHIVDAINDVAHGGSYDAIRYWALVYVAVATGSTLGWRFIGFFTIEWVVGMRASGREALFSYLLRHGNTYFENRFAGSVANKINHATDGAYRIVEAFAWEIWPTLISLAVGMYLSFQTNIVIGELFTAWFITLVVINAIFAKLRAPYNLLPQKLETKLRGVTVDIMSNIRAVQEHARRSFEISSMRSLVLERRRAAYVNRLLGEGILLINGVIQSAFMAAMVYVAVNLAEEGVLTPGSIILVITLMLSVGSYVFFLGNQITSLAEQWSDIREGLEDILHPYDVVDAPDAKALKVDFGAIEFKNASFAYQDGGRDVLEGFSVSIYSGQKVGLVGRSGAGKSTLIKLLLRHYDLTGGAIYIDGQSISETTQNSLREAIAIVPQEPLLFHRTIRENIAYGNPGATDADVTRAAELAKADEFIKNLPQQYDTLVGERGVKLSGGERQRVAIARAILKNAPILLLDEATSSLDSESEKAIQDALHTLMKGKTVIAIAHRLSTLREMDRIIVLEKGKIIEDGSHDELLEKNGVYAELWSHQSGGYLKDEDGEEESTSPTAADEE